MASKIEKFRKILWLCVIAIPLGYIAAEAGWIVAEVGRQPWAIQDLMPVHIAATKLSHINVQISFLFFLCFLPLCLLRSLELWQNKSKRLCALKGESMFLD